MTLAGGLVSVVAAAFVLRGLGSVSLPALVSYAIGAMLAAVFLDILPHALEGAMRVGAPDHAVTTTTGTILLGILVFFVLEKLVLWRHCHHDQCDVHDPHPAGHDHGRSGALVLVGDTFHNFVDGVLIAAAFLESPQLGIVTSLAIIAHEVPQELGNFVVLLNSGYSTRKALLFNMLSGISMVVGGAVAYFSLSGASEWVPTLLALAAASMLYVAVADLIPGLHKRTELKATVQQVVLIVAGVCSIWFVGKLVDYQ